MNPLCAVVAGLTTTVSLDVTTLENGLKVALDPVPGAATVAVAVGYPAGAAHVPSGRFGLAHLVEHLLFRRAGRLGEFRGTDHVEGVGGIFNGTTYPHRTIYWAVVPPGALRRTLFFERERMAFARDAITEGDLELEKEIVARELELRSGFGARVRRATLSAFLRSNHPWVGSEHETNEVARHTLDEVRWFIERYYRPNGAVLVVSGGFEAGPTLTWIRDTFGSLEPGRSEVAPPMWPQPRLADVRGLVVRSRGKAEELSRLFMVPHRAPLAARRVASTLLKMALEDFEDEHEAEVHDVSASIRELGFVDLLVLSLEGNASKRLAPLEADFEAAVAKLSDVGERFSEKDLARAKAEVELDLRRAFDTPRSRALIALHGLLDDEPANLAARLEALESVTLAEVEALVRPILATPSLSIRRVTHDGDLELVTLREGES